MRSQFLIRRSILSAISFAAILLLPHITALAQNGGSFRVGERITYSISFDKYPSAGSAEIQVVSRGKLGGKDAIELSSKLRTHELFSASVLLLDETATSIISVETGMPLFSKRTRFTTGLPKERTENFLNTPASGYDVLSLIYRIRYSEGGAVTVMHEGRSYPLTYQHVGSERVSTPSGDHETTIVAVQSDLLTELGIREFKVNIETGPDRVPVLFRAKLQNGEMRVAAASVQVATDQEAVPVPTPEPMPLATPVATPVPTPEPYVDNRPLSEELAFDLGEVLNYKILSANVPVGGLRLHARERRLINNADTLVLFAEMNETNGASGLGRGNHITAHVDPLTLLPRKVDLVFPGRLSTLTQSATFDERTAKVTYGGANSVDVPVGTHSILSFFYAVRSFKLKPSSDPTNPVNDTRVAVFWGNRAHVLYIRPTITEIQGKDGAKVPALLATITTEDQALNQLGLKVWLSDDVRRVPLRFSIGQYIFELENRSVSPQR